MGIPPFIDNGSLAPCVAKHFDCRVPQGYTQHIRSRGDQAEQDGFYGQQRRVRRSAEQGEQKPKQKKPANKQAPSAPAEEENTSAAKKKKRKKKRTPRRK